MPAGEYIRFEISRLFEVLSLNCLIKPDSRTSDLYQYFIKPTKILVKIERRIMGRLSDKVFEAVSAGIVHVSGELRILEHNRLGARFVGADETKNHAGELFFDVAENNSLGLKIAFQKVLADGKTRKFWGCPLSTLNRNEQNERNEKTFWDYTVSEIDGGIVLSAVEVTDRIKAERGFQEAIEDSRQTAGKLQTMIGQMADGVIVCDRDGNVTKINQAAERLLGEAAALFDGGKKKTKKLRERFKRIDNTVFPSVEYPWALACSEGETSIDVEMIVACGARDEVILSINAAPLLDQSGEVTGSVTVMRDVTENRRLILELREANRRLEEYNRLKAEFVANMSHELRTPLTAIIGFAQLMQMKHNKGVAIKADVGDGLERILRNGRHLLILIDEVLDLSKIEAGRLTLHLDHFELPEVIEETFAGLESLSIEKNLEYRLKIDGDFPFVFSDAARIRQIVLNLLSNAIKFTENGAVEAELKRSDENDWELTVKDTGSGIKTENIEMIFERFRQVDGSFTRDVGGFGLGLSISQQLAELLGGRITVESEYGAGSIFKLTLPFVAPRAIRTLVENQDVRTNAEVYQSDESESKDERQKILIIDDLPDSTRLLSEMLKNAGYRVSVAHTGAEGVRLARQLNPDAITLDIMMPGMDGWRVLQEMKADPLLAQIPVVVVSIVDNKPLGYRLGASAYLVKPVAPDNLLESLNGVVSKSSDNAADYVLVVDDDQGVRELLTTALKQDGFAARSAPSGEIGYAMAQKHTPAAVLTDLHMPGGMSGYELVARLRSQKLTAKTPIIIVTGKDLMPEDRRLISGQIADVIRKGDLLLTNLEERLRETLAEIGVTPTNGDDNAD
jgi:signal transduction histidine kinase/CheY-like chemotaxis protein